MTLSTSVIEPHSRRMRNQAITGSASALLCTVFTAIYEIFSHGAHSPHMRLMFLFPLIGCGLLGVLGYFTPIGAKIGRWTLNFWNTALATFTLGFMFLGIVNISGRYTSNHLIYVIIGSFFILLSVLSEILFLMQRRKNL